MSYKKQLKDVKKYNHDHLEIRCANQRINLEQLNIKISNLYIENKSLIEKLDIAVKDLETIVNACDMRLPRSGISYVRPEHMFIDSIRNKAQEALVKIKEIK